jgi:hypothetical protein
MVSGGITRVFLTIEKMGPCLLMRSNTLHITKADHGHIYVNVRICLSYKTAAHAYKTL